MHRPSFTTLSYNHHHHQHQQWQKNWARLLPVFAVWLCGMYGYHGDCDMVIGLSTSRLFKTSSLFVKQVEVTAAHKKSVLLYGFSQHPDLSVQSNWNVSNYIIFQSYTRKGFYLWLNKGSSFHLKWTAQTSSLDQLQVSVIKGERRQERLSPTSRTSPTAHSINEAADGGEAEYNVEEDDRYYVNILNLNPRNIVMAMNINVSSKMYDVTKAKSLRATTRGSCHLNIAFSHTQFIVVTTPNNGNLDGCFVELSFVTRIFTYVAMLAFVAIIVFFLWKYLGDCDENGQRHEEQAPARAVTERCPLMPDKSLRLPYGTGEEDLESNTSSSSEDLYDGNICVICYDMPRNCFFVPCGHCATCYDCAQRIMDEEAKVCPICRRHIHKLRRLIIP